MQSETERIERKKGVRGSRKIESLDYHCSTNRPPSVAHKDVF